MTIRKRGRQRPVVVVDSEGHETLCYSMGGALSHIHSNWNPTRNFDIRDPNGTVLVEIRNVDPLLRLVDDISEKAS